MGKDGKYIYCITETGQERNFGPIGIGQRGDEVLTIGCDDLSMVVSTCPTTVVSTNRENMLGHQKVIEKVMNEFDSVLPVRFGTVASSADEIRNLLDRRYREFKSALTDMDHKVELGVKGMWKNMSAIFDEVVEGDKGIKSLKQRISNDPTGNNTQTKIEIGKMVETALNREKLIVRGDILDSLSPLAVEFKTNDPYGELMIINAAFLVENEKEAEFDLQVQGIEDKYGENIKLKYVGALPPFNFVNLVIDTETY